MAICERFRLDLAPISGVHSIRVDREYLATAREDKALTMNNVGKIVVLGANSFSGQDFVDLLLDDPAMQVMGVSRSPERSALFLRYRDEPT